MRNLTGRTQNIHRLEERLNHAEQYSRINNIRNSGIDEKYEIESSNETKHKVISTFKEKSISRARHRIYRYSTPPVEIRAWKEEADYCEIGATYYKDIHSQGEEESKATWHLCDRIPY